jgi:branched-chain amino acid transport system permease protein
LVALVAIFGAPGTSHAQEDDERTVRARINNRVAGENEPVEGVTVTISTGGEELDSAETDENGQVEFTVQGRRDYTLTVDRDTLPDGIDIEEGEETNTITAASFTSSSISRTFVTGESLVTETPFIDELAQRLVNGTRFGLLIAISSVGLSLVFGTTRLTNFAHAEMVTFGGVVAFVFNVTGLSFLGWLPFADERGRFPLIAAGVITVLLGGLFGLALNGSIFGPLRRRGYSLVTLMVISVGLSIALKNLFLHRFLSRRRPYADYARQSAMEFGPITITARDLIVTIISFVVLVAVALSLQRTRIGKATRAVSDNIALASATGINSEQIIRIVWFAGGALAALGGIFNAVDEQVSFEMGAQLLFVMFAGITLGGLGSAFGALLGGFLVGMFVELATFVVPSELKNAPALVVLILVLLVRPQGILGRAERVG